MSRSETAIRASDAVLAAAGCAPRVQAPPAGIEPGVSAGLAAMPSAIIGFDGFVDSILHMVDRRTDMTERGYIRFDSITAFAARCAAAAGKSTNIEQVLIEDRFGGNGPLMAGAVGRLGLPTTYVGAVGRPDDPSRLHPVFAPLTTRCRRVVPIAPPSTTDCLEFDDGKLMFNNTANVQRVTWALIKDALGLAGIRQVVGESSLIGTVNWSLLGGVPGIWEGLLEEVFPAIRPMQRRIFVDLSDPAKRSDGDIRGALAMLRRLEDAPGLSVTLGLNLSESERINQVIGAGAYSDEGVATLGERVRDAAVRIRANLGLDCVVIHPREGAGAADSAGHSGWFDGPFTPTPKLSTGAGDHFNGGFAFAQVLGLSLDQCLATGCAVSGAYVRDAESPDLARLVAFLRAMPNPGQA